MVCDIILTPKAAAIQVHKYYFKYFNYLQKYFMYKVAVSANLPLPLI